ncbi:hypothetical protein OESDEN_22868 [Oesophagostomum dentatum]|uniref:Uncharacterized protein n=1 Tax=Oesophagostomum dentatum TaxID=61180 RepID=A0A0B1S207_OESDE|nr:hypothetical protein OESDEN_22868 [Oesophagostomum dentatum]
MFLTTTYYGEWDILSSNSLTPRTFACQVPNCAFAADKKEKRVEPLERIAYYDNVTT